MIVLDFFQLHKINEILTMADEYEPAHSYKYLQKKITY